MDEKLKILLGSEDIIARDNEDLFVNINLNRSFFEYKKEKYDNDFDLAKQFEKERNESRSFRIYGIVESNVVDCDSYSLKVYSDSGATQLIYNVSTSYLNFGGNMNVYNKKRGKYYIALDNYTGNSIYIKVPSNNVNISEQIFEQKLVFYDLDGEFISYGTETVEINDNLETVDINNNFPFFYNKHWIKKDLTLIETKQATVQFVGSGQTISEGQTAQIQVALDKPSPFGNEKVTFVFDPLNSTADSSDFLVYSGTPSNVFPGSTQLSFAVGEQTKSIYFQALNELDVELTENFSFKLDNFISVKSGANLYNVINILDQTPRRYAKYIVSNMYENRSPFVGKTAYTYSTNTYSTPSIFRNGLYYGGLQQEFYPIDNFELEIQNVGNKTLLPANSGLGNVNEQLWNAGEVKTFNISPSYSTSVFHTVEIYLPTSLNNSMGTTSMNSINIQSSIQNIIENISINGFVMDYTWYTGFPNVGFIPPGVSSSYEAFKQLVNGSVYDIYNIRQIPKPFTVVENPSAFTITLIASSPGIRLDVDTNAKNAIEDGYLTATATTLVQYSYPKQSPLEFTLLGNQNSNTEAAYHISFKKKDHKTLTVLRNAVAGLTPVNNYLVTAYRDMLHNWDFVNNKGILFSGDPMQLNFPTPLYFLPKSDIYYQGVALLSEDDTYKTYNYNLTNYGPSVLNTLSPGYWGPSIADFAIWTQTPLATLPETYTDLSTQTKAQEGLFLVGLSSPYPTHSSFDFRNGTSGPYTTFYWAGYALLSNMYNYASPLRVSGTTISPRSTPGLKYEIDLGGTFLATQITPFSSITINLPVGPIATTNPGYQPYAQPAIKFVSPYFPSNSATNNIYYYGSDNKTMRMVAKTPGVPFEIDNIIISGSPNSVIIYMPISANEIAGVTSNPYNNLMGGFTTIQP